VTEDRRCFYCDAVPEEIPGVGIIRPLGKSNLFPRSLGGRGLENKVDACVPCIERKGALHPRDWLLICPAQGRQRVRSKMAELGIGPPDLGPGLKRGQVPPGLRLGPCLGKVPYQSAQMADAARRRDFPDATRSKVTCYQCPECGKWHVGHAGRMRRAGKLPAS
jgi:hypothetical protein